MAFVGFKCFECDKDTQFDSIRVNLLTQKGLYDENVSFVGCFLFLGTHD